MDSCRGRHEETADRCDELRPTENCFSTKILGEHTANHLGQYVRPIERAADGGLYSRAPFEFPLFLFIEETGRVRVKYFGND